MGLRDLWNHEGAHVAILAKELLFDKYRVLLDRRRVDRERHARREASEQGGSCHCILQRALNMLGIFPIRQQT